MVEATLEGRPERDDQGEGLWKEEGGVNLKNRVQIEGGEGEECGAEGNKS